VGRYRVNVPLPTNWEQVAEESRTYRRKGVAGGMLRISLKPPLPETTEENPAVAALAKALDEAGMDLGQEIRSFQGQTPMGPAATSLRKSEVRGLLQFWLVAGKVTVFASYTMGSLAEAQLDLAEAQQIVTALNLIKVA
jgi:hypothetical protein